MPALLAAALLTAGGHFDLDAAMKLQKPESPQLSPDGSALAYSLVGWGEKKKVSALWLVEWDERGRVQPPRRLTAGVSRDGSPRWSPDGKELAFVSDRSGKPQIHLLPLDGGEAEALTAEPAGAGDPQW